MALAAICFVLYLIKRVGAYLLGGERSVTENNSSVLARLAYGGLLFGLFFLGPLAATEYFTPPSGLLATAVPPLQELQEDLRIVSKPLAVADTDAAKVIDKPAQLIDSDDANRSDLPRVSGVSGAGPTADDFLPPLDGAAPSAAGENAPSVDELLVAQADPGDKDGGEQRPADADVPRSRPSPSSTSPVTPKRSADSKAGEKSQVVVAEGAGTSPREALKDAFREAVRQVVGSVVDAETLIKNDELIDDKVLTYSDGFITKYDKIGETQRGGLVRIKISAVVERRSLVQKLKAANVTVKVIDGSGLFSEAVTQLEAEQNSAALIKKALTDLPTLLTAKVQGKPEFDKETSEIMLNVAVQVDEKAYSEFVKRLEDVLKKVSVAQDSTLLKGGRETRNQKVVAWPLVSRSHPPLGGPAVKNKSQWCIWVNTFNSASHDSLRWNGYVVDCDPLDIVQALEMPTTYDFRLERGRVNPNDVNRPSDAKTFLRIVALNANGDLVTEDQVELLAGKDAAYSYSHSGGGPMPFLRHIFPRQLDGRGGRLSYSTVARCLENRDRDARPQTVNLYIAPYSFCVKHTGYGWSAYYQTEQVISQRMKVTLDELKDISQIKCQISWKPSK